MQCETLIYGTINNVIFLEGEVIVGDSKMIFLFGINFILSDTLLRGYARKLKNYMAELGMFSYELQEHYFTNLKAS